MVDVLDVARQATNSLHPVLRLWGNRAGLPQSDRKIFADVGRAIGQAAAESGFALSGTMINENTLEYWAVMGLRDHLLKDGPQRTGRSVQFYLHFNGTEAPFERTAADLYKTAADVSTLSRSHIHNTIAQIKTSSTKRSWSRSLPRMMLGSARSCNVTQ